MTAGSRSTVVHSSGVRIFANALRAELTKAVRLRAWWTGVGVYFLLGSFIMSAAMGQALNDLTTLRNGVVQSGDMSAQPLDRYLVGTLLLAPYQSTAFVLPLVFAVVVGHEYRSQQILLSAMAVPARMMLAAAKMLAVGVLAALVCLAGFVLFTGILFPMLPPEAAEVVLSMHGLLVAFRIVLYGVTMSIVAGALTTTLRSGLYSLLAVVAIFVLASSGFLAYLAPVLHNALPLIGAQSFMFGSPRPGVDVSVLGGGLILLAWLGAGAVTWLLAFTKRDLA